MRGNYGQNCAYYSQDLTAVRTNVVILTSVKEIWLNAALQGVYLWAQDQEYASTVYAICLSVCHTLVFCQNGPTKGHANNTAEQSRDSCFLIQRF